MSLTQLWVPFVAVLAVVRERHLWAGVAPAAVLLVAPVASAVFYDFESPTYIGESVSIDDQDGWSGGGDTVVTSVDTDQLLRIGSNQTASHSVAGAGFSALTRVSVRTFISDTSNAYGELQLFDSNNTQYARIGIQNDYDHFYVFDGTNTQLLFDTNPVSGGQYYDVAVTLDFAAQKYRTTYTHEISGDLHADTGFVNFIAPTTTALAEGGRVDLVGGVSGRFAYFDKLSIAEPIIEVPGDYNGNGFVDSADYVVWRKNQGGSGGSASVGDSEPDGDVDDADHAFWRERFGNTTPGSGSNAGLSSSNVPEPASAFLLVIGAAVLSCRASTRRVR